MMARCLEVTLGSTASLKENKAVNKVDPYAVLRLGGAEVRTDSECAPGARPVWNHRFNFLLPSDTANCPKELHVDVWDNASGSDIFLGFCKVDLSRVYQRQVLDAVNPVHRKCGKLLGHLRFHFVVLHEALDCQQGAPSLPPPLPARIASLSAGFATSPAPSLELELASRPMEGATSENASLAELLRSISSVLGQQAKPLPALRNLEEAQTRTLRCKEPSSGPPKSSQEQQGEQRKLYQPKPQRPLSPSSASGMVSFNSPTPPSPLSFLRADSLSRAMASPSKSLPCLEIPSPGRSECDTSPRILPPKKSWKPPPLDMDKISPSPDAGGPWTLSSVLPSFPSLDRHPVLTPAASERNPLSPVDPGSAVKGPWESLLMKGSHSPPLDPFINCASLPEFMRPLPPMEAAAEKRGAVSGGALKHREGEGTAERREASGEDAKEVLAKVFSRKDWDVSAISRLASLFLSSSEAEGEQDRALSNESGLAANQRALADALSQAFQGVRDQGAAPRQGSKDSTNKDLARGTTRAASLHQVQLGPLPGAKASAFNRPMGAQEGHKRMRVNESSAIMDLLSAMRSEGGAHRNEAKRQTKASS